MRQTLALVPKLIPRPHVKLGSLILIPGYPHQDAFHIKDAKKDTDYFDSPSKSFNTFLSQVHGTDLHTQITTLVSAAIGWSSDASRDLTSTVETLYQLTAPQAWFESLCTVPEARSWLQKQLAVSGRKIYLICGYRTLRDPDVSMTSKRGREVKFDATLPGDAAISAMAGVPIDTGGMLDASAGFAVERADEERVSYEQTGEFVYAVHYRRVKFSWLTTDRASTAYLDTSKPNMWLDLTKERALAGTESDSQLVVEANLSEELEMEGDHFFSPDSEETFVVLDDD